MTAGFVADGGDIPQRVSCDNGHGHVFDSTVFVFIEARNTASFFKGKDFKMSKFTRLAALTAAILIGFSSLAEARIYCYDSNTGDFLHWGPCYRQYTPGRTYCYDRYTGEFLHWGSC